ncbi:MAG: site-specific integrase [Puniceicoccales bacterium]|jgi:integrase|nr:site-specific integrase [Puniceicoccales bacterium]
MGVILKKGRQGKLRPSWYGVYEIHGQRHEINLDIPITGRPPRTLREWGDASFESSRARAQEKLAAFVAAARDTKNSKHILEKIYEYETGEVVPEVRLVELPNLWATLPRSKKISQKQLDSYGQKLRRFVAHVQQANPRLTCLTAVKKQIVEEFLQKEEARGIAAKTYNDMVKLLKSVWRKLLPGFPNPLVSAVTKPADIKFRHPFSEEQLQEILKAATQDPFIYPIIVTGMCTAMRRADCCLLQWSDVDLQSGFISVKTSKTSARAEIPIWPVLREILESIPLDARRGYVFPEQAKMFCKNPCGITWRVKKNLRRAQIFTASAGEESKGGRLRHSSGYDFHSFRVTWITMALAQGIPIELVRRVTGHSTVEVVLKHYFKPDRENFRRVLENKMPAFLAGGPRRELTAGTAIAKLRELVFDLSEENFPERRKLILELVRDV